MTTKLMVINFKNKIKINIIKLPKVKKLAKFKLKILKNLNKVKKLKNLTKSKKLNIKKLFKSKKSNFIKINIFSNLVFSIFKARLMFI